MMNRILKTTIGVAVTVGILAGTGHRAIAGTLHNDWNYSIDSFRDGTAGNTVGQKSAFEFYGMAFREIGDRVFFAFNSNLSLNGSNNSQARNGKISYGDLFINFANPANFNQANGNLFAIRFDATNDTLLGLGLYEDVTAISLTAQNQGYKNLQAHTNTVASINQKANSTVRASYGDLLANTTYFNQKQGAYTTIGSGNFLGSIELIQNFSGEGLDFGRFGATGTQTFAVSFDRSLLPSEGGNFIANFFAECGNDGIVLSGDLADVPEPSSVLGFLAIGLIVGSNRLRRRSMVVNK